MSQSKNSFVVEDETGNLSLNKKHDFYYQVQTQLLVTERNYCDFVVWTSRDFFVERIYPDEVFQETLSEKLKYFLTSAFCQNFLPNGAQIISSLAVHSLWGYIGAC